MHAKIEKPVAPIISMIASFAATAKTAVQCAAYLRNTLDPARYYVYRGGSHVALHKETGKMNKGERLIIWTE